MSLQMLERLALNEFSGKAWAPYLSSRKQVQALVGPPESNPSSEMVGVCLLGVTLSNA